MFSFYNSRMTIEDRVQFSDAMRVRLHQYEPEHTFITYPTEEPPVISFYEQFDELVGIKNVQSMIRATRMPLSGKDLELVFAAVGDCGLSAVELFQSERAIAENTGFFRKEFKMRDLMDQKVDGNSLSTLLTIRWGVPCVVNGHKAGGLYHSENRTIDLADSKPSPEEVLKALAKTGSLPSPLIMKGHEESHAVFHGDGHRGDSSELNEALAYRFEHNAVNNESEAELVLGLVTNPLYEHINKRKLLSAVWYIDRLEALGMEYDRLLEVVRLPGGWMASRGSWRYVEHVFQMKQEELGLTDEGVELALMRYRLEQDIEKNKVRHIVQNNLAANYSAVLTDFRNRSVFQKVRELWKMPAVGEGVAVSL